MKLVKAYNSVSLVLRIVSGMVIGAALALLCCGEAAAQHQRHHRHGQAYEHLQVGHHVHHAQVLAQRQVGDDD